MLNRYMKIVAMALLAMMTAVTLTSCSDDDNEIVVNPDQPYMKSSSCQLPSVWSTG